MPLSPSSSSSSDLTATIQKNNKLCDAADMIIPHTETSGAMSQFLSQPTIPNELLVADNMRTFDPMAPTNIHSRADIDREQLEKLSHKPNRTYEDMLLQQKPMASFDVTNNQQDMFSRYVSPTTTFAMHTHKKSHPYHPLLQQHDMVHYYYSQHKRPYHSMEYVPPYKKSKSNASQHETSYMHQDLVSSPQQQRSRQSSMTGPFVDVNELASESQSTNDAALMYWVLDGSEEAAFYQVGTPPNNDDKQQPSPAHPTEFNPSVSLSTWPAAMEAENGTVTKLPLPQPSKPTSMPLKNWSAPTQTRTWSKFFFASEMQTLHYQTPPLIHFNEPSSSLSMGLNMMPEEEEETKEGGLFYPYHKGIKNTKEMVMMPSQQQEQSDTSQVASKAAAAAAAAAIWAAATADTNKPEKRKKPYKIN
ncbi:uncharacterized protein B0P05DRAFT_576483 [Gilbertella persicaria]|uniref:uncharacterized protein n=1 Tax=Gilbertella persicaria TaxID=101096 RepID=UPI00221F8C56|nr:uncharacterized protein B0P05DRAFT_576483 [Gilbertella persicaria]KAI8047081.1 hypothetical protein B0P05DRAFT_576483 [Gilbertella persicaria]